MDSRKKIFLFNSFPWGKDYKHVCWDEAKTGDGLDVIGTDGVASALVITLYDPSTKRGVLAHTLNFYDSPNEMLAENIIDTLLKLLDLTPDSPNLSMLEATLSGESGVICFSPEELPSNIVKLILKRYCIPIIGEDLGDIPDDVESPFPGIPAVGRLVFLNCDIDIVEVYRA